MKIKIEVDGLTLEHATELTKFLSSLQTPNDGERYDKEAFLNQLNYSRDKDVVSVEVTEKPKQTRKKAEKVEAPSDEDVEKAIEEIKTLAEAEEVEAIEVVEQEIVSAITLFELRELVKPKAAAHREAILSKLKELNATAVSNLDPKHYETLSNFLTEL